MSLNHKKIVVASPQRSGHNAIIKWMLYQNDNVDKFNEWVEHPAFENHDEAIFLVEYGSYKGCAVNKPDPMPINCDSISEDLIIWNFADIPLTEITNTNLDVTHVVILRDWRNYVASHMKHASTLSVFKRVKTDIFKEYANEFLKQSIFYPILFDAWFASKNYRIKICQDLGLYFTDIGKQSVPTFGRGSSFDELRFDGEAEKMDVLNRYKVFEESPEYQKFMDDTEAVELNNKILYRFMK